MSDFVDILKKIIDEYGDNTFQNYHKTHAILMDLANDQPRNRLLARNFVEADGYTLLKQADAAVVIRKLREEFSIEANAAAWIVHTFAEAMGLELRPWTALPSPTFDENLTADPVFFAGAVVAIGMAHTVAIFQDGTVTAHGRDDFLQCDVADWRDIVAIAAGDAHTIGLMANGKVVATGRNNHDQCDVGDLSEIAAVYAFGDDTICIRQDGSATACGKSKLNLSHFENIHSVAWHPDGIYGICHDGRVMLSGQDWEEENWASTLTDVVQIISTYVDGSLALCKDGRIYKMNEPDSYFAQLRDITAMVDLADGFAVLRKDGKVRILPYDRNTPRKKSVADSWHSIMGIHGKYKRLIGLTDDAHLLAACTDPDWLKRNGTLDFLNNWYPVGHKQP